jgi:pimeloyl-ACP methyl ester carboxylesterase
VLLNDRAPLVVMLHALGGSARAWDGVSAALGRAAVPMAIDLPGFGAAADAHSGDFAIDAMVARVRAAVAARAPGRWLLVGHSMGGKIATLLAADAARPAGLAGVVLLAASPPAPEPMEESRRQEMLGWVTPGPIGEAEARQFVAANVGAPLPPTLEALAVADVRRSAPAAWRAWLETGSREDRAAQAGRIDLPATIVAGGADGDLGEAAQRRLNVPHYPDHRLRVMAGAGHLLPLERPGEVAAAVLAMIRA